VSGAAEGTPVVAGPFQVLRELKEGTRIRQNRVSGGTEGEAPGAAGAVGENRAGTTRR